MTVQEYTNSCLKFAEASKSWAELDPSQFYTTFDKSWEMSGENQNGGIGIEWAFHQDEGFIKENAPQKFVDYFRQEMELASKLSGPEAQEIAMTCVDLMKEGIYSLAEVK
ncbi:MAG: hypothetical protein IJT82_05740 [Schwartzia sp.]|nr:hypothetical protein [Schwartzia sp. (in: firmicutes)]